MRNLIKKLLLFLPIVAVVLAINIIGDPANIFKGSDYEGKIARILISGKNVAGVQDFNERNFQRQYISLINEKNDIVTIGSSRSMQINSTLFPSDNFFNNSVSWATLEDYITTYNMYKKRNLIPKIIVLGLDPWILNKNNNITAWKSNSDFFYLTQKNNSAKERLLKTQFLVEKYSQILSPSYFQSSIEGILKSKQTSYFPTADTIGKEDVRLKDGSLSYKLSMQTKSNEAIGKDAEESIKTDAISALQSYSDLDKNLTENFQKFLEILSKDNVSVILFLSPYHPKAYGYLIQNYKIIEKAEKFFIETAKNLNLKLIGSYNPDKLKLNSYDFYDGLHLKREAVERLFKESQ